MQSEITRLLTTGFIWIATTLIVVATTQGGVVQDENAVILVAIAMLGAALSTRYVWRTTEARIDEAEKSKRHGSRRVQRLVSSLSDDELEELRARLSADGEVMPLEALLSEQRTQR